VYDDAAVRVELESRVEPYRVFVGVVVDEESVGLVVQREGVAVRRQCAYPSCDVPVDVGRREAVFPQVVPRTGAWLPTYSFAIGLEEAHRFL